MKDPGAFQLSRKKIGGFTLIELMMAVAIMGVLAGISIPNYIAYRQRADYAALQATMRFFMDAEDIYMIDHSTFYPVNGRIRVKSGVGRSIPELKFRFPAGHKHTFYIYGMNRRRRRTMYNYYYILVYADNDFNGNGRKDIFYYVTYFRNNEPIYHREFFQIDRKINRRKLRKKIRKRRL